MEHHEGGGNSDEIKVTKAFVQRMVDHVEKEEGFWRSFRIFAAGYTALFSFIILVIGWVLLEKNTDIKEMQKAISTHTTQLERVLVLVENQTEINKQQQARIDRSAEQIWRHGK